jgi:hypothetical protein
LADDGDTISVQEDPQEIDYPDWVNAPIREEIYDETSQQDFNPPAVFYASSDPEFYQQLKANNYTPEVNENILTHKNLYNDLIKNNVESEQISKIFANTETLDSLLNEGIRAPQIDIIFDNPEHYQQLIAEQYSPETAIDILTYPDLINTLTYNGVSDPLLQAIKTNQEMFRGLVEMNIPLESIQDIMMRPTLYRNVTDIIGDKDFTVISDQIITPPVEQRSASNTQPEIQSNVLFEVTHSEGYTQNIKQTFPGFSSQEYAQTHNAAIDKYGPDYLQGVPKYIMQDGGWGLASSGTGWWTPEVYNYLQQYLAFIHANDTSE